MTHKLTIEYDDELLRDLGLSQDRSSHEAKLLLTAKLCELRKEK